MTSLSVVMVMLMLVVMIVIETDLYIQTCWPVLRMTVDSLPSSSIASSHGVGLRLGALLGEVW